MMIFELFMTMATATGYTMELVALVNGILNYRINLEVTSFFPRPSELYSSTRRCVGRLLCRWRGRYTPTYILDSG